VEGVGAVVDAPVVEGLDLQPVPGRGSDVGSAVEEAFPAVEEAFPAVVGGQPVADLPLDDPGLDDLGFDLGDDLDTVAVDTVVAVERAIGDWAGSAVPVVPSGAATVDSTVAVGPTPPSTSGVGAECSAAAVEPSVDPHIAVVVVVGDDIPRDSTEAGIVGMRGTAAVAPIPVSVFDNS